MPGSPPRRTSGSSGLPEDPRLAEQRVRAEMQKYKVILQQIQLKLMIGKVSSIGKKDVQFFINELVRLVNFVQAKEHKPFVGKSLRSPLGLCTIVEEEIKLLLDAAKDLAEDLEKLDKRTPNYATVRRGLYMEFQRCLIACREPLNQALKQFKI